MCSRSSLALAFSVLRSRVVLSSKVSTMNRQHRYLSNRRKRIDLEQNHSVRKEGGVDGIYYVPDFVTAEEGKRLQQAARDGEGKNAEWKDLYKRRLQIHGGTPHPSGMVEEELPLFLQEGS